MVAGVGGWMDGSRTEETAVSHSAAYFKASGKSGFHTRAPSPAGTRHIALWGFSTGILFAILFCSIVGFSA